jgi:hypothetical protein
MIFRDTREDDDKDEYSARDVDDAKRTLAMWIAKRDAAWTVIEISRAGPNFPPAVYCMFKVIHGNAESEIIEARRKFERASMLYAEQLRVKRLRPRKTVLVDGVRTKLQTVS